MKRKILGVSLSVALILTVYFVVIQFNINLNSLTNQLDFFQPRIKNTTGSFYNGNYVYGAAMNLAWNDLVDSVVHEPIALQTNDQDAQVMTGLFNSALFTKNDLDEASYYIKSGYGQNTVNTINQESQQKFPSKSFGDLNVKLDENDIIAYAYFLKQVEYIQPLTANQSVDFKTNLFSSEKVKSFEAVSSEQKETVKQLKYWNDDKFIVRLRLKDEGDQLFLVKGFPMDDPTSVVEEISRDFPEERSIDYVDKFKMPVMHLDMHRNYEQMIGQKVANKTLDCHDVKYPCYQFEKMFENIKFDIDEKGARVENEAGIVLPLLVGAALDYHPPKPKHFILDKPFWLMMKRKSSMYPYFILGVNNTKLMQNY